MWGTRRAPGEPRDGSAAPQTAARPRGGYVAPANDVEAVLCAIWQQLLQVERVGTQDDFFELGGHSLLMTRLLSAVREAFLADQVELSIREFFEMPTIQALAALIQARQFARRSQQREAYLGSLQEVEEGEV